MKEFDVCNICDGSGSFENALEHKRIPSNVRKFKDHKFTVWRCKNCLSLHSKEAVDLAIYYNGYPINNNRLGYVIRASYSNRLKTLRKYGLKENHTILDFGCGTGLFVSFLKEQGYTAFGYDVFVDACADKDVLNRSYDIVVSYDVIEHFFSPLDFLHDLVKCLNKGGTLFLETPDAEKIDLAKSEKFSMALHQPFHRHILTKKALLNLGRQVDLELLKTINRSCMDTLYPIVNVRFLSDYVYQTGGILDTVFEKFNPKVLLKSPLLIFYCFFDYFFPQSTTMVTVFRKEN